MSAIHDTVEILVDYAHRDLIDTLQGYGSQPSEKHSEALRDLLTDYSKTALGLQAGRIAWPLAVGGGKSQSVASFIAACHKLGLSEVSVMVAQEKVEALCDLKRDLMAKGVPEHEIGLCHSYKFDPAMAQGFLKDNEGLLPGYASLPSTPDYASRRYLLLTHTKLKAARDIHAFNTFEGMPRSLVIWDESLIKSRGLHMSVDRILSALDLLKGRIYHPISTTASVEDHAANSAAIYMDCCLVTLKNAGGNGVACNAKTADEIEDCKDAIRTVLRRGVRGLNDEHAEVLCDFLSFTQDTLRLVKTAQGKGIITYDLLIPNSLQNVVVLDASHVIRKLIHSDSTIRQAENYKPVKNFTRVTVRQLRRHGGRHTMEKEMKAGSGLVKTIGDDLAAVPSDQGIIIFTYKQRTKKDPDHQKVILKELQGRGIDTDAMIDVERNGQTIKKKRLNFLTWGNETGLSKYSYCTHVLAAGIYRRSLVDYSASLAGQMETLDGNQLDNHEYLQEIARTEMFHSLLQALGRGSERETDNGMAKDMTASFIAWEDFSDLFEEAMPGVRLEEWVSDHIQKQGITENAIRSITKALSELPSDCLTISVRKLKVACGCTDVAMRTFNDAVNYVGSNHRQWMKVDRSLRRSAFG